MAARVTGAMIDFLAPGDAAAHHRAARRPGDPHRLADHHRGRLLHRSGVGSVRSRRIPTSAATPATSAAPKTVFGLILAGLMRRRADGTPPFTVMSCDNIPHNGHVTADAVVGLAGLVDPELADWVRAERRLSRTAWSTASRRPPPTASAAAGERIRHRGQLAGVLRAVQAMGAGGQFPRRPPGAGEGRRAVRRRCRALSN